MALHQQAFPYEEIRKPDGDYFDSWKQAEEAGYFDTQIWSVCEGDNDTLTYGPPHHRINVLGFVATKEHHDNDTYYEEAF